MAQIIRKFKFVTTQKAELLKVKLHFHKNQAVETLQILLK